MEVDCTLRPRTWAQNPGGRGGAFPDIFARGDANAFVPSNFFDSFAPLATHQGTPSSKTNFF